MEQTQYTNLIDTILEAEQAAGHISDEARKDQEAFESSLEQERQAVREKYMGWARDGLERLHREEQEKKKQALAAQDLRQQETSQKMEQAYAKYGDNWVDTLFHQVVDIQ